MPTPSLTTRPRAKLRRQIKHAELEARARLTGGDLVVDYGWGRLPYTGTETSRRSCITSIRLVDTRRTKTSFAASSTSSTGNGSIVAAGTDPIEIRIETLDSFAEVWEAPVALVKIDTEGYEPEVLRGATRLIDQHRPVLYLEMGGDYVESTRESIGILADAGYGVEHVRSIDWTRVGSGSDYFFLPRR